MSLAAGSRLGPYEIVAPIGAGGMGEVYKARDTRLNRTVAIKLIAPDLIADDSHRRRFLQEAQLAASVDHPHIAALYDIDQSGERVFIAMEYIQGLTLRSLITAAPLKVRRAVDLALQLGDALAKVHEHGMVHRDIKPENVIVSDDGYAKIIDFGLAKLVETVPQPGADIVSTQIDVHVRTTGGLVLGTSAYMSPEQARGEKLDARTDIFSFGVLLQEMLSGKAPFRRSSMAETVSAILTEPAPPLALDDGPVSEEVRRVIRKCLVKEPAGRYQSMRDVVVDLREIRDSLASGAQTAAAAKPGRRATQRRLVVAGATILVLAATAAIVWYFRFRPTAASVAAGRSGRPALAVLPFDDLTGVKDTAWLSKGLPNILVTGLSQTPDIEVIGPERLSDAAQQLGIKTLEDVPRAQLPKVAELAGAKVAVTGSIVQTGGQTRIDARVLELASGGVMFGATVQGADVMTLADELAARIRRGFDVKTAAGIRPVSEMRSPSVAANQFYSDAVEAYGNVRRKEAMAAIEKALALDPDFAAAHVLFYQLLTWANRPVEARDHLDRAARRLDRLSETDKVYVLSTQARRDGRVAEAAGLCENLAARFPEVEWAYACLAAPHGPWSPTEDLDRLPAIYLRGLAALPSSAGLRNNYGYALLRAGRFDDAIHEFSTYTALRPKEWNAHDSLADAYLTAGDVERAVQQFDLAVEGGSNRGGRSLALAHFGRYDEAFNDITRREFLPGVIAVSLLVRTGQYREAMNVTERGKARAAALQDPELRAAADLYEAVFAMERRSCAEVIRRSGEATEFVAAVPDFYRRKWLMIADLLGGTCEARMGHMARARARLAKRQDFETSRSPTERWWAGALRGEIALAAGDPAAAEAAFRSAIPVKKLAFSKSAGTQAWISFFANELPMRDGLARALAAQGRVDDGIAEYRKLLTPGRESKWTAMLDPRHVLGLARLLDRAGRRDEGAEQYRRFLDLWKHADADRPELAEARRRLSQ